MTALINDLANIENDVLLVFDDYYEIDRYTIHTSLAFLLDHLPKQIHLFIVTKSNLSFSLSRLRTSNQLGEIHDDDLGFSLEEAEIFLNTIMGLYRTFDEIATLHECTFEQVAGLQLAGLALQRQSNRASFIETFANTFLPAKNYLTETVFQDLPVDVLQFLLYTSLLDHLCGPLCQAVTGHRDSREMLALLEQTNLFLVALDEEHTWYQYQPLFADFLRTRLQQKQSDFVSAQLCDAAHWYRVHGYHEQATNHLLLV